MTSSNRNTCHLISLGHQYIAPWYPLPTRRVDYSAPTQRSTRSGSRGGCRTFYQITILPINQSYILICVNYYSSIFLLQYSKPPTPSLLKELAPVRPQELLVSTKCRVSLPLIVSSCILASNCLAYHISLDACATTMSLTSETTQIVIGGKHITRW